MNQQVNSGSAPTKLEMAIAAEMARNETALPRQADWIVDARAKAQSAFKRHGLAGRKLESWRYTDLRTQLKDMPPLASAVKIDARDLEKKLDKARMAFGVEGRDIIFVNGRFQPEFSNLENLPKGLEISALAHALENDGEVKQVLSLEAQTGEDMLLALGAGFLGEGLAVRVKAGSKIDTPLHLIFLTHGNAAQTHATRLVFMLEEGARAKIYQSHHGSQSAQKLDLINTDLKLGKSARLDLVKLDHEPSDNIHLARLEAKLEEGADLNNFTFSCGAALARHETHLTFAGARANTNLSGAFMVSGKQHCDNTLDVMHNVRECTSVENFKGVIDGEARGVFQGKITVAPDAQKTDGKQMCQALLLSELAEFDAKPELKIYADDVQCAHGATSGEIDEDFLFYLQARGIPEPQARAMLITAFVTQVFEEIGDHKVREKFAEIAGLWFATKEDKPHG